VKLYLMRHGEAESYAKADSARALTNTGRAAVASKASLLPAIDQMIVSPYLRALQTADILVGEGVSVNHRLVEDRVLPDCEVMPILESLIDTKRKNQLIVAHNPLLSYLVRLLCGAQVGQVSLATANIACLEADIFQPECASLLWIK
jgi:phosphohistidine phosphatase